MNLPIGSNRIAAGSRLPCRVVIGHASYPKGHLMWSAGWSSPNMLPTVDVDKRSDEGETAAS
jgi:hypothetical protein